ncbi:Uncharacterised protein [Shigella sonnei]|nr:Uncharacterised protein [Shigella sonnei]
MLNGGFINHFFQCVSKVRHDNNRRCAAIVKLMLKLTRGIQRVNVYDDHPGTQNAKQRHRILQ